MAVCLSVRLLIILFLIPGLLGGQYSPGFLTDLVREIRDAARIREEAMYTRIKAMVLERTDVSDHTFYYNSDGTSSWPTTAFLPDCAKPTRFVFS